VSEPKRYGIDPKYCSIEEFEDGQYVSYEDYARLKAEVERLRKLFADTERLMLLDGEYEAAKVGTYARLKAEVERLRKAGDAVCESPYLWEDDPAVIAWRAAKEGKQP
jgi:hypothetical protein